MIVALLLWAGRVGAECAKDVEGLRRLAADPAFPLHWIETGMDDGKPLLLLLANRPGGLYLRFEKSREGLWAEGVGLACLASTGLEVRFEAGQLHAGPAANWLLRRALEAGGRFDLSRTSAGELRVTSPGWTGRFTGVRVP